MTGKVKAIANKTPSKFYLGEIIKNNTAIVMFLVLFLFASLVSPSFFKAENLVNIMMQNSIVGLLAIGQTMVIICGGIDLSVGATLALTTMVVALTQRFGIVISLICGLSVGIIIGLLNGVLVAKAKMVPFIVTLATMGIARGIGAMSTSGTHIATDLFSFISDINIGIIPLAVITWVALTLGFQYLLKHRVSFRNMLAVGGDEETARLAGVKSDRVKILAYVMSGVMSSVGAIFYLSRLGHGYYAIGESYNIDCIAAVIIGGTSILGGKGSFVHTFFGILILGILENIINLLNMSVYVKDAFKGIIILSIILFTILRRKKEMSK